MSDRSAEWYSDPGNAERRKRRMRAYGRALTELGRRHPEERKGFYRDGVQLGYGPGSAAQNYATRRLRSAYQDEFNKIFEEQRREGAGQVTF